MRYKTSTGYHIEVQSHPCISFNDEVWYNGKPYRVVYVGPNQENMILSHSDGTSFALAGTDNVYKRVSGRTPESLTTPIWLSKDGKRVPAVIQHGRYVGTDGREAESDGQVYGLDSGLCNDVFGQPYPFGSTIGLDPLHYILKGATISLRKEGE